MDISFCQVCGEDILPLYYDYEIGLWLCAECYFDNDDDDGEFDSEYENDE